MSFKYLIKFGAVLGAALFLCSESEAITLNFSSSPDGRLGYDTDKKAFVFTEQGSVFAISDPLGYQEFDGTIYGDFGVDVSNSSSFSLAGTTMSLYGATGSGTFTIDGGFSASVEAYRFTVVHNGASTHVAIDFDVFDADYQGGNAGLIALREYTNRKGASLVISFDDIGTIGVDDLKAFTNTTFSGEYTAPAVPDGGAGMTLLMLGCSFTEIVRRRFVAQPKKL